MRILFFCIPAHGHTNPTLAVVRELVGRGHEVIYFSYEMMRDKIESAGAIFVSCDEYDCQQKLTAKDGARIGRDMAFSTKILVDTTLALDKIIDRQVRQLKPDCIVADSMAVWGKMAALKYGIPFVSSTTTFAFNKASAGIMKQSPWELMKMLFSMPKIQHQIRRLQAAGYPIKNVLDIISNDNDTHTIVYTSPAFQPFSDTFSEKYVFVGPSLRPAQETIVKSREKLVYVSMGTVNNDMLTLYRRVIAAFQDSPYQVIISVGEQVSLDSFGALPEHITVASRVDQIAVLEQTDVFITHCGMNSVSESLYFGVPLVMLPQTKEQQGVAERVKQLGAGMLLGKADADSILRGVNTVLCDGSFKECAAEISQGFHTCSGAKGAADKILEVCSER